MRRATVLGLLAVLAGLAGAAPARGSRIDAGHASARPPWVSDAAVRRARAYARRRAGRVSFAVAEPGARLRGRAVTRDYPSASVVKAMLLVAVLRAHRHEALPGYERALLGPMIRYSDNAAASAVYASVGGGGLRGVARAAGMRRFADVGDWPGTRITAADQARLFLRLDAVVPPRHRRHARGLLAGIVREQRWGIAAVADRRGLRIRFKGGWRSTLAHQVARVERNGRFVALAVLTDGDPTTVYGEATIRGIAERLLRPRPRVRAAALKRRRAPCLSWRTLPPTGLPGRSPCPDQPAHQDPAGTPEGERGGEPEHGAGEPAGDAAEQQRGGGHGEQDRADEGGQDGAGQEIGMATRELVEGEAHGELWLNGLLRGEGSWSDRLDSMVAQRAAADQRRPVGTR